jgi:hypothetical protein
MTAIIIGVFVMPSGIRCGIALAVLSAVLLTSPGTGYCQEGERPSETSNDDIMPSFDDIKDVCEAIQFVAISAGIAAALYWFWKFWLPQAQVARVEFDIDVRCVGVRCVDGSEDSWLIEVVATISNIGRVPAEIARCGFTLASVNTDVTATKCGPLADANALTPLFDAQWIPTKTIIDIGTRARFNCPSAIPRSVTHVVVTGQLKHHDTSATQSASKLVAMTESSAD